MYFLDLGPSGENLTLFFGLIFIFLNLFTYYMYAYNWSKNLNTFSLINFLNNLSFISKYSLKCFLWPRWLQDSLRLIQDQFGVVIQNKSSITHTRIRSGIFISAVLWSEGRFLGKSGTAQCPRTDLNKTFLPKTITAWKLIPYRSKISKNWNPQHWVPLHRFFKN